MWAPLRTIFERSKMSFKWNGDQFYKKVYDEIANRMDILGDQTVREIKQSFPQGSYRRWPSKKRPVQWWHWSSQPKVQPPAVDSGNLKDNVFYRVIREPLRIRLQWGISLLKVPYARAMEFGNPLKNVEHRPWLRPSGERLRKVVYRYLGGAKI